LKLNKISEVQAKQIFYHSKTFLKTVHAYRYDTELIAEHQQSLHDGPQAEATKKATSKRCQ
jgi:hypothetical protein